MVVSSYRLHSLPFTSVSLQPLTPTWSAPSAKKYRIVSVLPLIVHSVLIQHRNSPKLRHLTHFKRPRRASKTVLARSARTSSLDALSPQEQARALVEVPLPRVRRIVIRCVCRDIPQPARSDFIINNSRTRVDVRTVNNL